MKRKLVFIMLTCVAALAFAGCGDKETIGDTLINEDGSDIVGDLQQLVAEAEQEEDESSFSSLFKGNTEEEQAGDSGFAQIDTDNPDASVSEDMTGQPGVSDSAPVSFPSTSTYTADEDNHFIFSNITGINIDSLYISTSTGHYEATEILGGDKLKDGKQAQYEVIDLESLKKAGKFVLTVVGADKKGETIDFGSIEIVDATHMNIVLTKNKDGYGMYIE